MWPRPARPSPPERAQRDDQVALYLRGRARIDRVASLLCDVITWGLHRDLGFRGVDDYAEERLENRDEPNAARARIGPLIV